VDHHPQIETMIKAFGHMFEGLGHLMPCLEEVERDGKFEDWQLPIVESAIRHFLVDLITAGAALQTLRREE
jgi:hypothetical protein